MAQTFSPATGVTGSVTFANTAYCADQWTFDERINVINAPSFCGGRYMEYAFGKVSGVFSFSGIWNLGQNPFVNGMKVGVEGAFVMRINNAIAATAPTAVVTEWQLTDDADGVVRYTCSLVGDFVFGDFAGTGA